MNIFNVGKYLPIKGKEKMLKYIKVKNYLSFKDETVISFESDNRGNKKDNVFKEKNTILNKSLLIYGPNASGKTNILKVIDFIKYVAIAVDGRLYCTPFLLDVQMKTESSDFEIGYFYDNKEYKYSFSILDNVFIKEKFSKIMGEKEIILFYRQKGETTKTEDKKFRKEIEKGEGKAKDNVSFLAVLGQRNGKLYNKPVNEFFTKINIIPSSLEVMINPSLTINLLELNKQKNKKLVVEFLKCADIDVDDIDILNVDRPTVVINGTHVIATEKNPIIRLGHKVKGEKKIQYFEFGVESAGTRKLFCILGMIIDTIIHEKILFIDEIECNLHPHILKNIFDLIHSDLNKKYQFICTTHSFELMDLSMFKKSQIGITQKKKDRSTEFYTINDFVDLKLRSENDLQKLYNMGMLGGIPYVSDFSLLIDEFQKGEEK